jgi:hypothetical protein
MMDHEQMVNEIFLHDQAFQRWIKEVGADQQQVFWSEFFLVLKLLSEIYNLLKDRGIITRWIGKYQVWSGLRRSGPQAASQERVLTKIRDRYLSQK